MKLIKQAIRNIFNENHSTLNGIMLFVLMVLLHRFAGLSTEVLTGIDVALTAAALRFLTGTDNAPSTTPTPVVDAKAEGLPVPKQDHT